MLHALVCSTLSCLESTTSLTPNHKGNPTGKPEDISTFNSLGDRAGDPSISFNKYLCRSSSGKRTTARHSTPRTTSNINVMLPGHSYRLLDALPASQPDPQKQATFGSTSDRQPSPTTIHLFRPQNLLSRPKNACVQDHLHTPVDFRNQVQLLCLHRYTSAHVPKAISGTLLAKSFAVSFHTTNANIRDLVWRFSQTMPFTQQIPRCNHMICSHPHACLDLRRSIYRLVPSRSHQQTSAIQPLHTVIPNRLLPLNHILHTQMFYLIAQPTDHRRTFLCYFLSSETRSRVGGKYHEGTSQDIRYLSHVDYRSNRSRT